MTNSTRTDPAAHRRPRVLAPAAGVIGAAALLGGFALPGIAAAAAAPTLTVNVPARLGTGAPAVTFSASATNAGGTTANVRPDITISGLTGLTPGALDLKYEASNGTPVFTPVALTKNSDGTLTGHLGANTGQSLAADATVASTLSLAASSTAPGGTLTFRLDLDRVDSGTGAKISTLATASGPSTISAPSAPGFTPATPAAPSATVNQPYSFTLVASGASSPHFTATGLPSWLTLNEQTGTLTGTPTLADLHANPTAFTVTAANGVNPTATASVTIPVLFSDVATSNPFATQIYSLAKAKIISGYSDGSFRPGNSVTRQAFVSILNKTYKNLGGSTSTGTCTTSNPSAFGDVPASSPFCQDIASLAGLGVITGFSDHTFRPNDPVSRQAIAAYLYRTDQVARGSGTAVTTPNAPQAATGFSDVPSANPFSGDINYLVGKTIASGYPDKTFQPTGNSTRQASASFVSKFGLSENAKFPL